jgi:hypothetical protein
MFIYFILFLGLVWFCFFFSFLLLLVVLFYFIGFSFFSLGGRGVAWAFVSLGFWV